MMAEDGRCRAGLLGDDGRFTLGLAVEVSEVLRGYGYPFPEVGSEGACALRDLVVALWTFLYSDTDLGRRPGLGWDAEVPCGE